MRELDSRVSYGGTFLQKKASFGGQATITLFKPADSQVFSINLKEVWTALRSTLPVSSNVLDGETMMTGLVVFNLSIATFKLTKCLDSLFFNFRDVFEL